MGDPPELFVGGVGVLAICSPLLHFLQVQTLVIVLLPLMVFVGVLGSVLLERQRKSR